MDKSVLKNPRLYIAALIAILGVLLSQGVLVEGSTAAAIVGWVMTLLGAAGTGAATKPAVEG